jgi:hypothetical protein
MELHDALATLVDDVDGLRMTSLRAARRRDRVRRGALAVTAACVVGAAGTVAGIVLFGSEHDVLTTDPTTAPPHPQPPTGACRLPSSRADLQAVVAPGDIVARVTVAGTTTIDEVLSGSAAPGEARVVAGLSLLPDGGYVLVLTPATDGSYSVEGGRQGIFQLEGTALSQLCNNYSDPSHPLHAQGSLTLERLRGLLADDLGRVSVSGDYLASGGPSPGTFRTTQGVIRFESEQTAVEITTAPDGTFHTFLAPGSYAVTCRADKLVVREGEPVSDLSIRCAIP